MLLYTSPFHHALVGGLGALLTFVIIWGVRFLVDLIRNIKSKEAEQNFNEKKLYLVSFKFSISRDYWSELDNMLGTMYSKFRKENNDYSDGRTTINIEYTDNYRLRYYDNALLSKEIAKDKF